MNEHDSNYKQLFSHAQLIKDLLKGFVKEDWVKELDFSSLEKVNASYITDDLRDRADDIIWKVRWGKKDAWLFIYLLLEFQSSVDKFMAVRLMVYIGLLYQDLIKSKQLTQNKKLPPVLPLVLYNGKEQRWTAKQELNELIEPLPVGLENVRLNAIKLRFFVGWVGAIPCGCPRNIVMGRPTHHCYKFQRFGGFRSALPTLQKKRIYA